MATESNTNSTTKVEEQAGASGKSKVTKKCLIFEKLIKENISQEPVQRVTKATNEVKKGLGQDPYDQEQLLYEGKYSHHTEVPETQHQHAGHVPPSHQEDQVLEQGLSTVQQVLETQHQRARLVPEEENRTAPPPAQLHVHGQCPCTCSCVAA